MLWSALTSFVTCVLELEARVVASRDREFGSLVVNAQLR